MSYDLLIRNARVVDGTGMPAFNADVGVRNGKIAEIGRLRGVTWLGPREASVTLYEFFDYNCPWCRAAARDLDDLVKANPDLRIGLVNNPILSVQSAQAAKVAMAVQRAGGSAATASRRSWSGRASRTTCPLSTAW